MAVDRGTHDAVRTVGRVLRPPAAVPLDVVHDSDPSWSDRCYFNVHAPDDSLLIVTGYGNNPNQQRAHGYAKVTLADGRHWDLDVYRHCTTDRGDLYGRADALDVRRAAAAVEARGRPQRLRHRVGARVPVEGADVGAAAVRIRKRGRILADMHHIKQPAPYTGWVTVDGERSRSTAGPVGATARSACARPTRSTSGCGSRRCSRTAPSRPGCSSRPTGGAVRRRRVHPDDGTLSKRFIKFEHDIHFDGDKKRPTHADIAFIDEGHLDLELVRVHQVLGGDAEARRGDLLDLRAHAVAVGERLVPRRVLAPLAAVAPPAEAVHGDGDRLVGLLADGAEGHGRRDEAGEDLLGGLHLLEGDRLGLPEAEEGAERGVLQRLVVDGVRVLLEGPVVVLARGVLEAVDRLGVPQVLLAAVAELVDAARVEELLRSRPVSGKPRRCRSFASPAITSSPTPPTRDDVWVKYMSTMSRPSPTASKIWEPKKLRRVEMPMRLKVLRSPFFTAVMYLSMASPTGRFLSRSPASESSRMVAYAT